MNISRMLLYFNGFFSVSICELLGTTPLINCKSVEYLDFIDKTIVTLWKYTHGSYSPTVNIAAFGALSNYKCEMMTLKQFPEKYREDVVVPSKLNKIQPEENLKPEDVLDYVPSM